MNAINLYLLRHGKPEGKPALYGHTDVGVDKTVQRRIVDQVRAKNWGLHRIISSPLKRCSEVADQIHSHYAHARLERIDAFKEMSFGDLDGLHFDGMSREARLALESFWQAPASITLTNAESLLAFHDRVTSAWDHLMAGLQKDTLLIAHSGSIRMILAHVLHLDWTHTAWYSTLHIDYQSLSHVQLIRNKGVSFRVKVIGEAL